MNWATPAHARLACALALTICCLPRAWAQQMPDPVVVSDAEVVVPVADRSVASRDAALRTALDASVARLAGERALTDFWVQPTTVLSSYQYRREFDGSADVLKLRVTFDVAALRQALRDSGFVAWDAQRPPLLLWAQAGSGWMDSVQAAREIPELMARSQAWGFNLRFPQLDMAERQQVYSSDIGYGSVSRWLAANAAYGMPWALAVALQPASAPTPAEPAAAAEAPEVSYWTSRWTLADDRQILAQFELPAMPLAEATDAAWKRMNGVMLEAEEFRRKTAPTQGWTLEFVEVVSAEQYLQLLSQLRALDLPVRVRALTPDSVSLAVEWKGTASDLRRRARQWGWTEVAIPQDPAPVAAAGTGLQTYGTQPAEVSRFRFALPLP